MRARRKLRAAGTPLLDHQTRTRVRSQATAPAGSFRGTPDSASAYWNHYRSHTPAQIDAALKLAAAKTGEKDD
jgi:hypothetical protein